MYYAQFSANITFSMQNRAEPKCRTNFIPQYTIAVNNCFKAQLLVVLQGAIANLFN